MNKILVDTHIFVWMATDKEKIEEKTQLLTVAAEEKRLYCSAISLWEIVMIVQRGRLKLSMPVKNWLDKSVSAFGIKLFHLTPEILIESCLLPGEIHGDPADRMIIATAKIEDATLITKDKRILNYAATGNLRIL